MNEFHWPAPPYPHDPAKAKQLLAEAGYPRGFDAGDISSDFVYAPIIEAVANSLGSVGIRVKVRPMERAAFVTAHQEKKLLNLIRQSSAAAAKASTRVDDFVYGKGMFAYGSYPDIDALF